MRIKLISSAVLVFALVFAGCSNSKDSTSPAKSGNPATGTPAGVTLTGKVTDKGTETASANEIKLDVYDDYFSPTFIKVEPSKKYVVKLHNVGQDFHTFTIASLKIDVPLKPGDLKDVELTTPASGSTEFICKPHAGIGMRGALFIA